MGRKSPKVVDVGSHTAELCKNLKAPLDALWHPGRIREESSAVLVVMRI
jgi:hypothetical protein